MKTITIKPLTAELNADYLDFFDNRAFTDGNPNGPCYCTSPNQNEEDIKQMVDEFKVFVRFEFSGLSNTKYMSDEFDKNTSLEDFFNYQKNSDNIRACNTANLSIMLEHQPLIKEQNVVIEKTEQIFTEFSEDLKFTQMEIITITDSERCKYYDVDRTYYYYILNDNKSGKYISGIRSFITDEDNYSSIEISDSFFKNEEEF